MADYKSEERDVSSWIQETFANFTGERVPAHFPAVGLLPHGLHMLLMRQLLQQYKVAPRGIIHGGGHRGEELYYYALLGFQRVMVIEPHPGLCEDIRQVMDVINDFAVHCKTVFSGEPFTQIVLEPYALGSSKGSATLYETAETAMTSTMKPTGEVIYRGRNACEVTGELEVTVETLDNLMAGDMEAEEFPYNVMRLNIQGSEMAALEGAARVLPHMDLISLEVNFEKRYEDVVALEDMDAFMEKAGLKRVRLDRYTQSVGNAVYRR